MNFGLDCDLIVIQSLFEIIVTGLYMLPVKIVFFTFSNRKGLVQHRYF